MGSPVPHASGDYPAHGNSHRPVLRREELSSEKSCPGEQLRKWKSLEGDWRTFLNTDQIKVERRWATHVRGSKSSSENQVLPSRYPENGWQSMRYRKNPGYKNESNGMEWRGEEVDFSCQRDRYCASNPSQLSDLPTTFSSPFRRSLHLPDREDLKRVVNSSYPLLEENLSLLQKLKEERDLCRQLENDMIDLEGQIQDVSKSFHTGGEVDSREDSCTNSERGSEAEVGTPSLGGSYEQVFGEADNGWNGFNEAAEEEEELDPITVIETSLSSLMDLADRLELAVRERDLELRRLIEDSSLHRIPTEWFRPSFQLSRIPSELVDLLQDLQAALRLLLANRDWECGRQQVEKDCSSPASFTFQAFDDRVLVPTVRTIFSPVGDSVEMRPVEEPNADEEYPSTISLGQCSELTAEPLTFPEQTTTDTFDQEIDEEAPDLTSEDNCTPEEDPPSEEVQEPQEIYPVPPTMPDLLENQPSEIIKRIERLQELVKPELCESLKQRALRIQKAKEDFLSGVIGPPPEEPPNQEPEEEGKDILIVDSSVPSPNGLTVKEETEEKRSKLSFLRKKKRQSWGSEELCRESLVLEDKSDWLRNPFRPKGKYKINK